MSTRPRRAAAAKAAVVVVSDSDEEVNLSENDDYRPPEAKNSRIDRAADAQAGGRQRWPTSRSAASEAPAPKRKRAGKEKENENACPNEVNADPDVQNKPSTSTKRNARTQKSSQASDPKKKRAAKDKDDEYACSNEYNNEDVVPLSAKTQPEGPVSSSTTGRSSFWERRKVWSIHELLAETENIQPQAARNIVQLFENENTIPFICRYRRDLVDHIAPDRLRDIRNTYTEIVDLRKKAEHIVGQLDRENVLNREIREELMCAKTNEELEFLYAPYKPASKGTLAERAKALGLEEHADRLLYGSAPKVNLSEIVDPKNEALATEALVMTGICNIIIHNISKNTNVLEEIRRLQNVHRVILKCSKTKESSSSKSTSSKASSSKGSSGIADKKLDSSKFENYFNFQCDVQTIKPYQMLAINRAEKNKFLSVKLDTNDYLKRDLMRFITDQYMNEGLQYPLRREVFSKSLEECYSKKLQPLMCRQIRTSLKEKAQKAAIDVFAKNLKQLLLMSPLKGERILGIDPGYTNGCKIAVISETADVLDTGVIYPHGVRSNKKAAEEKLIKLLSDHNCKIIALGNGTACRSTEHWLSDMFTAGILDAKCIRYSIVNENGASVYSCSDVAVKEFPKMDTNERSAVSIARRLNDPLSEYVKIEPRHLGVGMYQHDISEKILTESLNDIVSECVSFVGVDLNTASLSVLKHIAGLTEKKAEKIIEYRTQNGPFKSRKDLLSVRTIGEKTFVQCAGFVRIEPLSVGGRLKNPLDCTWVHPESYEVAESIVSECELKLSDVGKAGFIATIKQFAESEAKLDRIAKQHKLPMERLEFLLVALQRELLQDYRADLDKRPLFKQGLTRLDDLSIGDVLTGAVTNVTQFGAFVDVGVDRDGLIHNSNMKNSQLSIGDRIVSSVVKVDLQRRQLGLRLENMLMETDTSFTFKTED
ncbi:S1 RNA-binding domain-containing protein 1 isoform X2 [Drosophila eugracilis]|uniref:S1 RNA-binding domain-containing protein 1 isoform X2 n=1 Tax=Drosophila eugracilis TaxID=29029 RepID=UPI0007E7E1DC|nr:S1 RNA-binding domain-containing protein 1 isoform X2 [Drosophila eugracilis]